MMTLLKNNAAKILTVFSLSPGSRLNRKTLQEKTKMNNIILDKTINQLVNFNFLCANFFIFSYSLPYPASVNLKFLSGFFCTSFANMHSKNSIFFSFTNLLTKIKLNIFFPFFSVVFVLSIA